jgi:hypothetical protein
MERPTGLSGEPFSDHDDQRVAGAAAALKRTMMSASCEKIDDLAFALVPTGHR